MFWSFNNDNFNNDNHIKTKHTIKLGQSLNDNKTLPPVFTQVRDVLVGGLTYVMICSNDRRN